MQPGARCAFSFAKGFGYRLRNPRLVFFFCFFTARSLREDFNQLDAITRVSPKHPEHRAPHYILIILFIADGSTTVRSRHLTESFPLVELAGTFARLHAGYKVFSSGIKRTEREKERARERETEKVERPREGIEKKRKALSRVTVILSLEYPTSAPRSCLQPPPPPPPPPHLPRPR